MHTLLDFKGCDSPQKIYPPFHSHFFYHVTQGDLSGDARLTELTELSELTS